MVSDLAIEDVPIFLCLHASSIMKHFGPFLTQWIMCPSWIFLAEGGVRLGVGGGKAITVVVISLIISFWGMSNFEHIERAHLLIGIKIYTHMRKYNT